MDYKIFNSSILIQSDDDELTVNLREMKSLHKRIKRNLDSISVENNEDVACAKKLAWLLDLYPWEEMTNYNSLWGNGFGTDNKGAIGAAIWDFILDIRAGMYV
jgi:hypothetical protein